MFVLVTGGAGFIGSFLVEKLLAEGHQVCVLDTLEEQVHGNGAPPRVPASALFYHADVRNRDILRRVLEQVQVIVHCAAIVGIAQSLHDVRRYVDVNVGGTANLLQLLVDTRETPRKLIVLTSMSSYGEGLYRRPSDGRPLRVAIRADDHISRHGWEPVCPETGEVLEAVATPEDAALAAHNIYALTKRYQEELAFSIGRTYSFPVVCLRLFNVYGPRQSLRNPYTGVLAIFLSRLLSGRPPVVYEDGRQTRDFVSVHDVVDAILAAMTRSDADNHAINVGSGIARRVGDVARTLAHAMGLSTIEPDITGSFRKGDVRHCYADITLARTLLRFEPRVTWETGLQELLEWSREAQPLDLFAEANRQLRDHNLLNG
jgi:dTDP-L-rhamnose 4-epimerase